MMDLIVKMILYQLPQPLLLEGGVASLFFTLLGLVCGVVVGLWAVSWFGVDEETGLFVVVAIIVTKIFHALVLWNIPLCAICVVVYLFYNHLRWRGWKRL